MRVGKGHNFFRKVDRVADSGSKQGWRQGRTRRL